MTTFVFTLWHQCTFASDSNLFSCCASHKSPPHKEASADVVMQTRTIFCNCFKHACNYQVAPMWPLCSTEQFDAGSCIYYGHSLTFLVSHKWWIMVRRRRGHFDKWYRIVSGRYASLVVWSLTMAMHRNGIIILNRPTENKYTDKRSSAWWWHLWRLSFHAKFDATNVSFLETRTGQLFRYSNPFRHFEIAGRLLKGLCHHTKFNWPF